MKALNQRYIVGTQRFLPGVIFKSGHSRNSREHMFATEDFKAVNISFTNVSCE